MKEKVKRSPLFYVGDKYKLISEIKTHFPQRINKFVEPFVGGGSVFMNIEANKYILNDIDTNVIEIHKYLSQQVGDIDAFFKQIWSIINKYGLSCSYLYDIVPLELKQSFPKTYFAKFNKDKYSQLKSDYNKSDRSDILRLYLLLIYGFNRMLRFNSKGDFNLPVGNVDFNANTVNALNSYFEEVGAKNPQWSNLDFRVFLPQLELSEFDLVYLDPPYLITFSEYNKLWNDETERDLINILDDFSRRNIKFAISNVTHYKGRTNDIFIEWAKQYNMYSIKSNYISYHDNTIKTFNEVLVTNY